MVVKFILALAATLSLLIPNLTLAQVSMADRLAPGQSPVIVADGRMRDVDFPDDSLAAFRWAIDRGVDMLVVNVQRTGDDKYIVLNEATLTRSTNVRDSYPKGAPRRDPGDAAARWHLVADYTLEEIKQLRLLDPKGGDHPVPTLEETLDLIDGRILAVLNLKGYDVESLSALLKSRETEGLLLNDRDDLPNLRAITEATGIGAWSGVFDAHDPMAALEERMRRFGSDMKVIDVESDQLNPDFVARAEQLGVRLCLRGMGWEDVALTGGNTKPWLEAFDGPTALFMTEYPDTVLGLMGR